jgi:hypothetical protein
LDPHSLGDIQAKLANTIVMVPLVSVEFARWWEQPQVNTI